MDINALVVDDSGIMRKLVMRSLMETQLAQFIFTEAKDGQDAVNQFDPDKFDIVFADWNMPNMTGIEMVKHIRANFTKHVPIVMITTEGTMGKIEEALDQCGADGYIVKPFTTDVMKQKLTPLFDKISEAKSAKNSGFFNKLAAKLA